MNPIVAGFDHELADEATKKALHNVIKRKLKFDRYKFKHLISLCITMFSSIIFLFYVYYTIVVPYSFSVYTMLNQFITSEWHLFMLIWLFFCYGGMDYYKKKMDKAEKEYHALRCEIVDRGKDLWKGNAWLNRHLIFEKLKQTYDINLYHENK